MILQVGLVQRSDELLSGLYSVLLGLREGLLVSDGRPGLRAVNQTELFSQGLQKEGSGFVVFFHTDARLR